MFQGMLIGKMKYKILINKVKNLYALFFCDIKLKTNVFSKIFVSYYIVLISLIVVREENFNVNTLSLYFIYTIFGVWYFIMLYPLFLFALIFKRLNFFINRYIKRLYLRLTLLLYVLGLYTLNVSLSNDLYIFLFGIGFLSDNILSYYINNTVSRS